MKIIHCADLHLDSKLTANLDKEKAKQRKQELLLTFKRMVSYAADNGIEAILICGDLFDTKVISATARNTVLSEIVNHPDIDFYYLKGNHDSDNFLSSEEDIPDNLKLFGDTWTEYDLSPDGKVKLYGIEFNGANTASAQVNFVPDPSDINIVMLHGQESESSAKDKAEIIDLKAFRNKGINYLALGHIHEYKCDMLDGEGKYCYPGCLEGRGFDECGEHGFVELNIDTESGKVSDRFVSFALRKLYEINVDITGLNASPDIILRAKNVLSSSDATDEDLVKVVLTGEVDVECEKDIAFIANSLKDDYYFLKVYDNTKLHVDYDAFTLDESLKGEFVRLVKASELDDDEKADIIRYGLNVIAGGDIDED